MNTVRPGRSPAEFARTRAFPPSGERQIGVAFEALLPPGALIVDLGAGTGRLAHILLARGFAVTALDLSRPMLAYLAEHRPPSSSPLWLTQADVAALPLSDRCFDAALSVHVLHIVERWRDALTEALRVLKSGGLFIRAWTDHQPADHLQKISQRWREILEAHGYQPRPGVNDDEDVARFLRNQGWADRLLPAAAWTLARSPREILENIRRRHFPFLCDVPDDLFPALFAELEAWAGRAVPDLEAAVPRTSTFMMRVFSAAEASHAH
jgi:SAM-dependent methyltransferase